jgi:hypothetical protein
MLGARIPSSSGQEWFEGGAAAALVGVATGALLTDGATTAETGQIVWFLGVILSTLVAPRYTGQPFVAVLRALPFQCSLLAVLYTREQLFPTYIVAKVIFVRHVRVPLSAATDRDMVFRYGLFFLFVLFSSVPLSICITMITSMFMRAMKRIRLPERQRPISVVLLRSARRLLRVVSAAVAVWILTNNLIHE